MKNEAVYQVTRWSRPHDSVLAWVKGVHGSEHALVRYDRWLNMEIERWANNENARESWVQQNDEPVLLDDGTIALPKSVIALFSWSAYQRPVMGEE